jgi:uncharacterized protein YndB with AHSA1/START domain
MPNFKDSVQIRTDRQTLWSLLTTVSSILQWYEGLDTLEATADYPAPGSTLKWTYKVAGIEFKGTQTVLAATPGEVIRYQLDGLISGTQDWRITETPSGLQLEVDVTYSMSGGVLGKLAEPVVHQMNVSNGKKSLSNLKQLAEGQ